LAENRGCEVCGFVDSTEQGIGLFALGKLDLAVIEVAEGRDAVDEPQSVVLRTSASIVWKPEIGCGGRMPL
jgi:hypothetical protein